MGVALGVCLVMLFTGLARGMSNDLQRRSSNVRAEIIFRRPGSQQLTASSADLPVRYAELLREIEGVEAVVPVIRYVSQGGSGFGFEQIEGIDWPSFAAMNGMSMIEGRAPTANDEIIIDETKARTANLRPGSTLNLIGGQAFRVTGIYTPESGARIKMTLGAMQEVLGSPDKCSYIFIKCREGVEAQTVAARINETLPGNSIQFTRDIITNLENRIPYLGTFLRVLVGLAAIVSALVVMLAMYTTVTERTREIGILKALGASRSYIVATIEKEAILISVIGLIVGFAAALIAGTLIHRNYGLMFEYGWGWAAVAALIGLIGGALGALYPAMRAARLDPVDALSYD